MWALKRRFIGLAVAVMFAALAVAMAGGAASADYPPEVRWMPEVEDEVVVLFEQGDVRFPYVIGGLWNAKDTPPDGDE